MNPPNVPDTGVYAPLPAAPSGPPESISEQVEVEFGSATHAGLVRPNNEDCFLVARIERTLEALATNLPPGEIPTRFGELTYGMVVADGLGGSSAGEVASRLAVSTFVNLVLHTPDWIMRGGDDEAARVMDRIAERYRKIGAALTERSEGDAALAGMATTMTLAVTNGADLFLGHVGDSRAYLLRGDQLAKLTRDHTYAQDLADAGQIAQDQVATHRGRHMLTRALGPGGSEVDVDVGRLSLRNGDQLLLCTDGLTGMVDEDTIRGLLASGTAAAAAQALVDAALANGGKDNVTVVIARYGLPTSRG